jgi:hypothetical protein
MIGLVIIIAIVAFFMFRRIRRRKALDAIALKPYRYNMEIRRSPWANRGGF